MISIIPVKKPWPVYSTLLSIVLSHCQKGRFAQNSLTMLLRSIYLVNIFMFLANGELPLNLN